LRLVQAQVLEAARANAWNFPNISTWFEKLNNLLRITKYHPKLIFQLDETSLCVQKHFQAKKVVSRTRQYVPTLKIPPIYRCTALLIIQLSEDHLKPHLIFAKSHKLPIDKLITDHSYLHINDKGWMEKVLFEDIMKNHVLSEIETIRQTLRPEQSKRALLIMDGHSSRLNRELWEQFSAAEVDVIILPSHTSEYLQPLDLGVNGVFKEEIRGGPKTRYARHNSGINLSRGSHSSF
jgi:hypothetical protein